ncbi:amylo-alpha-1,6-glucosidase [Ktedonosporobacter rubrisoli]|uniref:Amylo-alpha-1,6-glucosidase n=1 Tax=Ktedonosporobacter rubrisoli TaxID=2509675 RepID=A0A4P6JXA9_KTERU|nr:glycogen debranching N-terminal domain-containing protein [Ktedonosporobacter rubrisoli]QBD80155.1 amylo-alpha-1,6-glucosidase [Ktedonosporobacter rubrisoli]
MTDNVSEAILLQSIESKADEEFQSDLLEDQDTAGNFHMPQITLKYSDAFFISDVHGDITPSQKEMGLFWHGTRFLRACNLFLQGRPLQVLSHHVANMGNECQIDLTNHAFTIEHDINVEQGTIHVNRYLDLQAEQLVQVFTVTSFYTMPVPLTLSLKLGADFCDLFEVRGSLREAHGQQQTPERENDSVIFSYQGLDDVERQTRCAFMPAADRVLSDRVFWKLQLKRDEPVEIRVVIKMKEANAERFAPSVAMPSKYELPQPTLTTDDPLFNRLLTRGMNDLTMLSTLTPQGYYPYAGIPWFSCPFGRDGLITCLEFLPWFPDVTRGALKFLAAHQGNKVEPFTDEEPGKMLHELRTGEMANCREIPYIPYYGSIDVTPLFLITLEKYTRWTNDLELAEKLWPNVEAAARWIVEYGDRDGDGFIEYHKASEKGLANQGWKDAWDSVSHSDGLLARSPIALCEVQGYAFAAFNATSYLAGRLGKTQEVQSWQQRAQSLRENFLRHFWWEEEQVFYEALDAEKKPCDVVSSNAGQCLWSGIVPEEQAQRVVSRLMQKDMYNGWGMRTLSTQARRYNPMSYHNGSVWPHDTAMVGEGFARYGRKTEAGQLLQGIYHASLYFEAARLPELYCGFPRREGYGPTRYPVACSPQAWAAGAPFLLVNALLGFRPDAEHHCLRLDRPTLPEWLQKMEIRDLHLGGQHLHLRFVRSGQHTQVIAGDDNEVELDVR